MVVIATPYPRLAETLHKAIGGPKAYILKLGGEMLGRRVSGKVPADQSAVSPHVAEDELLKDLCDQLTELSPEVLLLDVRLGGGQCRVIEAVPTILRLESSPQVVLLSPWHEPRVEKMATDCGCFDVIDLDHRDFLAECAETVAAARAYRAALLDVPSSGNPSSTLQ